MIDKFKGEYEFLSNFHLVDVILDGEVYPSVEHAYQAAKFTSENKRAQIRNAPTPADAKKLGRTKSTRDNWNSIKTHVMAELIQQKFVTGSPLAIRLLDTGNEELIEGNWWGDTFWGICNGKGENHLGKILMTQRDSLR